MSWEMGCSPPPVPLPILTDGGDGSSVGHEAEGVVEDAAAVEEWRREAHALGELRLKRAQTRAGRVVDLVVEVVLAEGKGGNQRSAVGKHRKKKKKKTVSLRYMVSQYNIIPNRTSQYIDLVH